MGTNIKLMLQPTTERPKKNEDKLSITIKLSHLFNRTVEKVVHAFVDFGLSE